VFSLFTLPLPLVLLSSCIAVSRFFLTVLEHLLFSRLVLRKEEYKSPLKKKTGPSCWSHLLLRLHLKRLFSASLFNDFVLLSTLRTWNDLLSHEDPDCVPKHSHASSCLRLPIVCL
jgi:hypothetical protein